MNNGIAYVTPDPCPRCGGRVSTGVAGVEEDNEKYMYVCGQCDTWFDQKGYPTTSKRYVTDEAEVDALRARVAGLEESLALVLPMAKGWAHEHPVGSNATYCQRAHDLLYPDPEPPTE